jgi:anti-sigma factor RsiW
MDCNEARIHLLELGRQRLPPPLRTQVEAHLESCPACRRASETERALDGLLVERLPRHAAPPGLRRRLEVLAGPAPRPPARRARTWARLLAPALAAALALMAGGLIVERRTARESAALATLTDEAVSDHLRVLASQHPLEIESGGAHVVKPWFEGRLDFAPRILVPETGDLRLRGGAVGYFLDRKAAVIEYSLRLHAVTLVVFRVEGLAWPAAGPAKGPAALAASTRRGFNVVLWRSGELGHALVSDANEEELRQIAAFLARGDEG